MIGPWQPIETVPKNGTAFLGFARGCFVMVYLPSFEIFALISLSDDQTVHVTDSPREPTHWMPLPEPPPLNSPVYEGIL